MADKALVLAVFLAKSFDDPDGTYDLLDHGHRGSIQLFHMAGAMTHQAAGPQRQEEKQRSDGECDQRQFHVNACGYIDHAHQREKRGNQGNDALDRDVLDRWRIMLNSVNTVGCAVTVMKGQGKPLDVIQELSTKIPNQLLSGVGLQPPAG